MPCPSDQLLAEVSQGLCSERDRRETEDHLDECEECRELFAVLAQDAALAVKERALPTEPEASEEPQGSLGPGVMIGHYKILAPVGAGGMGIVCLAHDTQLDRKVALKVLRDVQADDRDSLAGEARSLARLSHPNVVAVHELGEWNTQSFVAMEYVEGTDFAQAVSEASVQEIVATAAAAGRGLAAAHRAGLVHRDVKPSNILVSEDVQVKITDFGLAERSGVEELAEDCAAITRTQMLAGTPAYMAPEQLKGHRATAKSDQFSLCVTLYEALCGERPLAGQNIGELRANLAEAENVGTLPLGGRYMRLSRPLRRCLARGLALEARHRFPDVDTLVRELEATQRSRHPVLLASALAVSGLAIAGTMALRTTLKTNEPEAPCQTGHPLEQAWNHEVRARFVSSLSEIAPSQFTSIANRAAAVVDAKTQAWASAYRDNCRATHVLHEQSEQVLDLRTTCLRDQRIRIEEWIAASASPTAQTAALTLEAAMALPDANLCSDIAALNEQTPLPREPERRHAVERLQAEFHKATARHHMGLNMGLVEQVENLSREAEQLNYPPLDAALLHLLARLKAYARSDDEEATVVRALQAAAEAGDDRLLVDLWLMRGFAALHATELSRVEDHLSAASIAASRAAYGQEELHVLRARLLSERGDHKEALREAKEGLALMVATHGETHVNVARVRELIAQEMNYLGTYEEAFDQLEQAIEIYRSNRGNAHPSVATALTGLGKVSCRLDRVVDCENYHRQALQIRRKSFGEDHLLTARSLDGLGAALYRQGRYEEASRSYQEAATLLADSSTAARVHALEGVARCQHALGEHHKALESHAEVLKLYEAKYGLAHPRLISVLNNTAVCLHDTEQIEEAQRTYERGLSIARENLGATHPSTIFLLSNIAELMLDSGHASDARKRFSEILKTLEADSDEDSATKAFVLTGLGRAELSMQNAGRAIPFLRRAVAMRETTEDEPTEEARSYFELGKALEATEAAEAKALVARALEILEQSEGELSAEKEEVRAWLAERR